jgi:hypothetical protein
MSPGWLDDVSRFAQVLETTQQELLESLRLKRKALISGSALDLQRLNDAALEVARRLKGLTVWRTRLLEQAHLAGDRGETISDVLAGSISFDAEQLRGRLAAVQNRFSEARREAWIQWIIAQRTSGVYTDVLDLLARGGRRSPIYGETPNDTNAASGAVLDAAV